MGQQDRELQRKNEEKNIANCKKERELINKAKENQEPLAQALRELIDVRKKMHLLAMKNYVYVNPTYAFQSDPEYIVLQKEMAEIEFRKESINKAMELEKIDGTLKNYDEQLKTLDESQAKAEAKLKELGE